MVLRAQTTTNPPILQPTVMRSPPTPSTLFQKKCAELKKSVYLQLGIYVYSEYFTFHIYNNQTLKTMLKKNVKLILVMSAMILAGQEATAQLISR